MEKERWNKVRDIFSHLCDQSPSFRANYLDMVCAKDTGLRNQVERMLKGHDAVDSHEAFQTPHSDKQTPDAIGEFQIDKAPTIWKYPEPGNIFFASAKEQVAAKEIYHQPEDSGRRRQILLRKTIPPIIGGLFCRSGNRCV